MGAVEIHPFDVNQLQKGDFISAERCEAVLGVKRSARHYRLELLKLKDQIERQWLDLRDEVITIECERDGLLIDTDERAVGTNRIRRRGHVRGLEHAQVRQMGVDVSNLTPEQRDQHERECVVGAAFLLGGKREIRAVLKPHQRARPLLKK